MAIELPNMNEHQKAVNLSNHLYVYLPFVYAKKAVRISYGLRAFMKGVVVQVY